MCVVFAYIMLNKPFFSGYLCVINTFQTHDMCVYSVQRYNAKCLNQYLVSSLNIGVTYNLNSKNFKC